VHGPDRFFDRRGRVGPVAIQQVDVVHVEPPKRAIDALEKILAIERIRLVRIVVQAPEEFGRHQVAAATPAKLPDRRAHNFFRFSTGIRFRIIEEVDAVLVGRPHHFYSVFDACLQVKRHPGSERKGTYL